MEDWTINLDDDSVEDFVILSLGSRLCGVDIHLERKRLTEIGRIFKTHDDKVMIGVCGDQRVYYSREINELDGWLAIGDPECGGLCLRLSDESRVVINQQIEELTERSQGSP